MYIVINKVKLVFFFKNLHILVDFPFVGDSFTLKTWHFLIPGHFTFYFLLFL